MRSLRLFRCLLWGYPGPFRQEYGAQMTKVFAEQLQGARTWRDKAALWREAVGDLILVAPREHWHVLQQDLRYAFRTLRSQPGFTVVAMLSLALGIGANVALFGLVNSLLLRFLPVREPQELVMLTDPAQQGTGMGAQTGERSLLSYEEFLQLRAGVGEFTALMASQSTIDRLPMRVGGGEAEETRSRMVSTEYFDTLGVPALVGRAWNASEDPRQPLAVISYDYWQRRFGGRREALGARMTLREQTFTVIGVMPPSFFGETVGERPDVWLPMGLQPSILPGRDWLHDHTATLEKPMWLHVFGRLPAGVPLERAQAAANVVLQQGLSSFYASSPTPEMRRGFLNQRLRLRRAATGASELREEFSRPLLLLLAGAVLILLIACANLGNLLLARATARLRDVQVRLALGAGRGDLIRQTLAESLLLALGGGVAGVGAAVLMRAGLLSLVSDTVDLPAAPDFLVLAYTFGLTLLAGLLLGLLPALRLLGVEANGGLREQARGAAASAAWLRAGQMVVAGQVALSLPLLVGAGLLVQSLRNLQQVELGYPREGLLMLRVDVRTAGYEESRRQALFERLHTRLAETLGVRAVSYSKNGLLLGGDSGDTVEVEGYAATGAAREVSSRYEHVGPQYFSILGVPLRLGREITASDRPGGPKVCVINEAFAKTFFQERNPLGRHVTQVYGPQRNTFEVVGVVANFRQRGLRGEIEERYFVPVSQPIDVPHTLAYAIRTSGDPTRLIPALRRAVLQEDPRLPIMVASPVERLVSNRLVQDRLLARLSLVFGAVALLLAAIGLYGVLSYGVARRTSEIGIRKALGAREGTVVTMILRETGWLLLAGLLAGAAISSGTLRWMESQLYGLAPGDPVAMALATAMLALVALLAAGLPAYRASRVDPLVAIRYE